MQDGSNGDVHMTVTDAEVDAVLYEHEGDAREAIRALLHDLAALAEDYAADVSYGYVRGAEPRSVWKRRG